MTPTVKERLEAAIREAEQKRRERVRAARATSASAEQAFAPVRKAAEDMRSHVGTAANITFTITPESVGVALMDRELWFTYDAGKAIFVGEESAHNWYDGERYENQYAWADADQCIDAMIRLTARYVLMARAIESGGLE